MNCWRIQQVPYRPKYESNNPQPLMLSTRNPRHHGTQTNHQRPHECTEKKPPRWNETKNRIGNVRKMAQDVQNIVGYMCMVGKEALKEKRRKIYGSI